MPIPERRANDTPKSYAALCDYAAMGAGRSLSILAEKYRGRTDLVPTRQESRLGYWSAKYDWAARVQAYDNAILADEEQARAAIRAARRLELEESDWAHGALLRQKVAEIALELPKFIRRTVQRIEKDGAVTEVITLALNAGPGELARAMKLASELQRLSVGEPTEHTLHEHEWIDSAASTLDRKLLPDVAESEAAGVPGESDER